MGQRTNILLQVINKNGEQRNYIYYSGWGIGRIMPVTVMGYLCKLFNHRRSAADFFETAQIDHTPDIVNDAAQMEECGLGLPPTIDIDDAGQLRGILSRYHNDNGAIVMQVAETREAPGGEYRQDHHPRAMAFRIGFMLGPEDADCPFSEYIGLDEWCDTVGGDWVTPDFREMFRLFLSHFSVEILTTPKA